MNMKATINYLVAGFTQHELLKVLGTINDIIAAREAAWHNECNRLVADNKRAAAIRVCRDATGWPLKESIEYIDTNFVWPNIGIPDDGIPF